MTRLLTSIVITVASVAGLLVWSGDLEPPGAPAPTMKPLDQVEPRTPIRAADLPLTISTSGSYYAVEDLVTAGAGIKIEVDNVTIDLMGFGLSGGLGDGIKDTGTRKNIIVRNGTVTGWNWVVFRFLSNSCRNRKVIRPARRAALILGISCMAGRFRVLPI